MPTSVTTGFSSSRALASEMTQAEIVTEELKSASASLALAIAATEKGDWAAAEQGVIDAQERGTIAMREIQAKLMEPPTPAEDLED